MTYNYLSEIDNIKKAEKDFFNCFKSDKRRFRERKSLSDICTYLNIDRAD